MLKKIALIAALTVGALPAAYADVSASDVTRGTPVVSSDGGLLGAVRSNPRFNGETVRLFVRAGSGSFLLSKVRQDMIIDVPQSKINRTSAGLVLDATTQTVIRRVDFHPTENRRARIRIR